MSSPKQFEVALKEYAAGGEKLAYQLGSPFGPYLATRVPKVAAPVARASSARASKGGAQCRRRRWWRRLRWRVRRNGGSERACEAWCPATASTSDKTLGDARARRKEEAEIGPIGREWCAQGGACGGGRDRGSSRGSGSGPRTATTTGPARGGDRTSHRERRAESSACQGERGVQLAEGAARGPEGHGGAAGAACRGDGEGGLRRAHAARDDGGARAGSSGVQTPGGEDTPTGSSISQQLAFDAFFGSR